MATTSITDTLLRWATRIVLLAAALLLAMGLTAAGLVLLALWAVRAGWARLTGKPATPFVMRFGPRGAFEQMMRRQRAAAAGAAAAGGNEGPSRTPRADAVVPRGPGARRVEVEDVEVRG